MIGESSSAEIGAGARFHGRDTTITGDVVYVSAYPRGVLSRPVMPWKRSLRHSSEGNIGVD